jgi:hypothetical protein
MVSYLQWLTTSKFPEKRFTIGQKKQKNFSKYFKKNLNFTIKLLTGGRKNAKKNPVL